MLRKIGGYVICDAQVVGQRGNAHLSLNFLSKSDISDSGYAPAESVSFAVYSPEELEGFCDELKALAGELRTVKSKP